ncbi:hypothetical protein Noda2021_04720 [Candidatus Dependentiae bacterium Noda2021]|nr:hypothetical protein Noda2021_04720 [Candidatus Dependentiae bacterium Noda2021]
MLTLLKTYFLIITLVMVAFCNATIYAMEKNEAESNKTCLMYQGKYKGLEFFDGTAQHDHPEKAGAQILDAILKDTYKYNLNPSNKQLDYQLSTLVKTYWSLYHAASKKIGFMFPKGTIKLIGKRNLKIYDVFLDYIMHANPALTGTDDKRKWITFNPRADSRDSTHFNKDYPHYGIDIVFNHLPTWAEHNKLPYDLNHLLIGKIDENTFFIKAEEHGIHAVKGLPGHTLGVGKSVIRKNVLPFLEKYAPSLCNQIEKFTGKEHDPHARRETVPADWVQDYTNIIEKSYMKPEDKIKEIALFKKNGTQHLTTQLNKIDLTRKILQDDAKLKNQTLTQEQLINIEEELLYNAGLPHYPVNEISDFLVRLNETHDNLHLRQGCEVILTDDDLKHHLKEELSKK